MPVILVTEMTFEAEVLKAPLPVLLDIYTPLCAPCHQLAPILDRLASEFAGRVTVAKLNGSIDVEVAVLYRVMSVPTLVAFREGQEVDRRIGVQSYQDLRDWLEELATGQAPKAVSWEDNWR